VLNVEQWAELRRLHFIERVGIRELTRRFGLSRKTVRRALRSTDPPRYSRRPAASKLDPFTDEIHRLLKSDPRLPVVRMRELLQPLGYSGGETILKEHVREVRPLFLPVRTYQRTVYLPGEIAQCDLWEPRREVPVGFGQTRRGYVVTMTLGYSRIAAGTLIFSKEAPDILAGLVRCLLRIGGLPKTLVWDREGALHAGGGRPTGVFAAFCGRLKVAWHLCAPRDPEAKGVVERHHGFLETSFEPARLFASPRDFQEQLDAWYAGRANVRFHRGIRARPIDRLAHENLRPLPEVLPDLDRRNVLRVPPQPYARVDTVDYSLDPRLVGRRVELRASQSEVSAVALDTGEVACRHERTFARHVTVTSLEHARLLREEREARQHRSDATDVEIRPLARYDALIPA
jgi:transposase